MKIKETPNSIIMIELPFWSRVIGLLFFAIGLIPLIFPDFYASKFPLWLSIVFIIFGGLTIVYSKRRKTIFDKQASKIFVMESTLIKKQSSECDFSNVRCITLCNELESALERRSNKSTSRYWLELVTKEGISIELTSKLGKSGPISFKVPYRDLGQKLASYVNAPFEELPSNPLNMIERIKNIVQQTHNESQNKKTTTKK